LENAELTTPALHAELPAVNIRCDGKTGPSLRIRLSTADFGLEPVIEHGPQLEGDVGILG
jgi:hypothetical protein